MRITLSMILLHFIAILVSARSLANPAYESFPASGNLTPSVAIYYGGEVGLDHVYAQRAVATLKSLGISYTPLELSVSALGRDNCQKKLVILTDIGAFTKLPDAAQNSFSQRCKAGGSQWFILYAGIQTGEFHGLKIGSEPVIATNPSLQATLARDSFLRLPLNDVEQTLPGFCRVTLDAGRGLWKPAMTALVAGERKAIAAISDEMNKELPSTLVLGCDLYPSAALDLLLTDLMTTYSRMRAHERFIAIDIDDVFQPNWNDDSAQRTVKLQSTDVQYLLALQERLSALFAGSFQFALGFNAFWFERSFGPPGTDDIAGDRALVQYRDRFRWFNHLYAHEPAIGMTSSALLESMAKNSSWADQHDVSRFMGAYAVSPAHLGTLPPYEPLYMAWQKFGVTASTAFEILPGEKARRHRGITVMPRLSCGVACYSDAYSMSQVSEMELRILADQIVIPAILANPFVVFMSHQSDYARDHLAGIVFERAMMRLSQWTTLSYRNLSSEEVVLRYAKAFGVDVTP